MSNKIRKLCSFTFFLFLLIQPAISQNIPAKIIPVNDAVITFEPDGSMIVEGTALGSSGIAPPIEDFRSDKIREDEMLLVNTDFFRNKDLLDFSPLALNMTPIGDDTKGWVRFYRYPAKNISEHSFENEWGFGGHVTEGNNGTVLAGGLNYTNAYTSEPFDPTGDYAENWSFEDFPHKSNQHHRLWNRFKRAFIFQVKHEIKTRAIFYGTAAAAIAIFYGGPLAISYIGAWSVDAAAFFDFSVGSAYTIARAMQYLVPFFMGVGTFHHLFSKSVKQHNDSAMDNLDTGFLQSADHIFPQKPLTSYHEVELLPDLSNTNSDYAKQVQAEMDMHKKNAKKCSFDNNKKCYYEDYEPIYARISVTDAHLKSISIPGLLAGKSITPYQMFREYYYEFDTGDIVVELSDQDNVDNINQKTVEDLMADNTMELPRNAIKSKVDSQEVTLTFKNYEGFPYFYIALKEGTLPTNLPEDYFIDMGSFGTYNNESYHLFRILAFTDDQSQDPKVTLTLNEDGPFLVGDNLIVDNPIQEESLVVNGDDDMQAKIVEVNEDGTTHIVDSFEATVYGNMAVFSEQVENPSAPLAGTDKWAFYIGGEADIATNTDEYSPPTEVGALTEDAFITAKENILLPDYVFEPHYKKRTLSELDAYITKNKHLPDVPGIKEVAKAGYYKAPEMMFGQLKNLEELYLHAFDQQTKLDQLQKTRLKQQKRLLAIKERLTKLDKK